MATSAAELAKLVSTAAGSAVAAEDGDKAEAARAVDVLKQLAKNNVTADLLRQTEAGKKVNKMAKSSVADIAKAADAVVQAWKECVKKQQAHSADNITQAAAVTPSSSAKPEPAAKQQAAIKSAPSTLAAAKAQAIDLSSIKGFPPNYAEVIRKNACKMFAEGLALAVTEAPELQIQDPGMVVTAIAIDIESAAFSLAGSASSNEYKAKVKQLMFNLRDPSNPDLRRDVLDGSIQPEELVTLEPEGLASRARQAENDKIRKHMAAEAVRGGTTQASTDQFQCPRCKQRKCTYYQLQTRSADEPMTTFVSCTVCMKRWKFC